MSPTLTSLSKVKLALKDYSKLYYMDKIIERFKNL